MRRRARVCAVEGRLGGGGGTFAVYVGGVSAGCPGRVSVCLSPSICVLTIWLTHCRHSSFQTRLRKQRANLQGRVAHATYETVSPLTPDGNTDHGANAHNPDYRTTNSDALGTLSGSHLSSPLPRILHQYSRHSWPSILTGIGSGNCSLQR